MAAASAIAASLSLAAQDEAGLIARAQAGDRDAFGELYTRHRERVHHGLRLLLRDFPDDVEDMAADVFMVALTRLPAFDPERSADFWPWLRGIVRLRAKRHLSWRATRRELELAGATTRRAQVMAVPGLSVEDAVVLRLELARMLRTLPARRRLLLLLRDWAGWPYEDIANALGASYDAVAAQTEKARREARLAADGGPAPDRALCSCGCGRPVTSSRRRFASRRCVVRRYQRRVWRTHLVDRQPRFQRLGERVLAVLAAAEGPVATRQVYGALPDVDERSVKAALAMLRRSGRALNIRYGYWCAAGQPVAAA